MAFELDTTLPKSIPDIDFHMKNLAFFHAEPEAKQQDEPTRFTQDSQQPAPGSSVQTGH